MTSRSVYLKEIEDLKSTFFHLIDTSTELSQWTEIIEKLILLTGIENYALFIFNHRNKETKLSESITDPSRLIHSYPILYDNERIALLKHDHAHHLTTHPEALSLLKTILIFIYLDSIKKIKLDQELLKKDLEIAAKMQGLLIPKELFKNDSFNAVGLYKPNYLIGGDYYDVISINENKIAFCIADISGKGINAAILMANFQAILKSILVREFAVEQAIDILNHKVFEITKGEKFITLFLGIYNTNNKRLVYANCGHNPIGFSTDSHFEWLDKGTTILGAFETLPFIEVGKLYIEHPSKLFLYTDGILNLKNEQNQYLSLFDLENLIYTHSKNQSIEDTLHLFESKIQQIDVEENLKDDISLLLVEIQ